MTRFAIGALVLVAISIPGTAFASDCSDAREHYNQAVDTVSYALTRYTRCLNSSGGRDDCSTQFRRLRSAQSDLESAVSEIGSYCEY